MPLLSPFFGRISLARQCKDEETEAERRQVSFLGDRAGERLNMDLQAIGF